MEMTLRLLVRSRRLYEQGVDENRLRRYIQRWFILADRRSAQQGH